MFRDNYPLVNMTRDLFEIKKATFFVLLCLITFLLLFIKKNFIVYELTAFQILDERGELGIFKMISALQYFSIPLIYLWKFTFIAFIIWVGCFGFGYRITYTNCWHIVMVAEIIFIFPEILKIFWFLFFHADPIYADVKAFYPFSLMNFFDWETIDAKWHYPLKALNLFEVIYWIILIAGIYIKSGKSYRQSAIIALFGYIIPFLFWLMYYTFIYE